MASPFQEFNKWMFDGNINTEIPVELLSYNSPITHKYVLSVFMGISKISVYINEYLNNKEVWIIPKSEFFLFFKTLVIEKNILRKQLLFIPYIKHNELYKKLEERYLLLKPYEIESLCFSIENSNDKDIIYYSLGLIKDPKITRKKGKKK